MEKIGKFHFVDIFCEEQKLENGNLKLEIFILLPLQPKHSKVASLTIEKKYKNELNLKSLKLLVNMIGKKKNENAGKDKTSLLKHIFRSSLYRGKKLIRNSIF